MDIKIVLFMVGVGLIALGGVAGVALLARAIAAKEKEPEGQSTLWGLFLVGLIGGIMLMGISMAR